MKIPQVGLLFGTHRWPEQEPLCFSRLPIKARDVLRQIDRMSLPDQDAVTVSVADNFSETLCLPSGWTVRHSFLVPPAGHHPEPQTPAARIRWLCQSLIREGGRDALLTERFVEEAQAHASPSPGSPESPPSLPNATGQQAGGSPPATPSSDSSDFPSDFPSDSLGAAQREAERQADLASLLTAFAESGRPELSHTAYHGFGGFVGTLPPAQRSLVQAIRNVLRRWIADASEDDDGPRIDWARGIVRVQTGRSPQPMRRQERGRPALSVLLDNSWSCAGIFQHAAPLATALGLLGIAGADVDVFVHSNGWLHQHWRNGRLVTFVPDDAPADHFLVPSDIPSEFVVALGDWDAADFYAALAARPTTRRFVWLDGWRGSTSQGPFLAPNAIRGAEWPRSAQGKTRYVAGMHATEDWIVGLRLGLGL